METLRDNPALVLLTLTWAALTAINLLYWLAIEATPVGIVTTILLVVLYAPAMHTATL